MKLSLAVLTAMVAFATVDCQVLKQSEGPLYEDIKYFMDMIPIEEVADVVTAYFLQDAEVQDAVMYLLSDDYKELMREMQAIPEFRVFLDYLEDNGVHVYDSVNAINGILGLEPLKRAVMSKKAITGGLAGLFHDVLDLIHYPDVIHGYAYKMRTSEAFRGFINHLQSANHQKFIHALYSNERYLKLRSNLINKGVDVALIEDTIYIVVGVEFPVSVVQTYGNSQLSEDINDFLELAFTEEIINVLVKYFATDAEVQAAIEYAFSKEFHEMVLAVEALKEYQEMVLYMHAAGLDIFEAIQKFHELVGMDDYVPPKPLFENGKYRSMKSVSNHATGGIKAMVEEIKALLPIQALKNLFNEKMKNSPAFADFIAHMSSPEMQKIINSLYTHEIFLEMRSKALAAGLDLAELDRLLLLIFGIELPQN